MCISERLKQVLDAKNMTVTEFSKVTGISYRSAMNYLNEGRDPNVDALVKIHKGLGINITWLLTGDGVMFDTISLENSISVQEKELIGYYRMISNELKKCSIYFTQGNKKIEQHLTIMLNKLDALSYIDYIPSFSCNSGVNFGSKCLFASRCSFKTLFR